MESFFRLPQLSHTFYLISEVAKSLRTYLLLNKICRLTERFDSLRRQLVCRNCKETSSFHRNGNTPGNPPQPTFICKSCGKAYNAPTVVEIVGLISTETIPHSSDHNAIEISRYVDEQPDNVSDGALDIAQLQATIQQLYTELKQTKIELQQAHAELLVVPTTILVGSAPSFNVHGRTLSIVLSKNANQTRTKIEWSTNTGRNPYRIGEQHRDTTSR
ncbi:hypothetical protein BCV72DRAFT_310417 [Rhizopus microsporus var. microsporus]|uniref:Uncharacterized protein n=1 Tax=Rhizopus microsporus var. microsporus TaxID=86635 RepID=A0A1X0QMN3_RHIZD|nr:hypothetical protein BCV72DRAFT_310417 [Rhizopus microsporus var. microsporus]